MYKYPFHLLKAQRFFPFFITQFFGALNDNVFKISVLTLIAFHLSTSAHQNQIYQTLGAGLFTLPFFLFSAIAGQIADSYNKVWLMRGIKCIEILFMLLGAISIYYANIPLMFSVIFLMGLHSAFFGPLKYAILPEHLKQSEWLAGNAFVEAGTFIAILIGTLSGSLLIPDVIIYQQHLFLPGLVAIGIAILGALSSFFIPNINHTSHDKSPIHWHIFRAIHMTLKETKKYPTVFPAIIGISWFWFVGASLITEFPTYVAYTLQGDKNIFTCFLILFSMGIGAGSLLGSRLLKGNISARHVSLAMVGVSVFIGDIACQHFLPALQKETITLTAFLSHIQGCRIAIDFFLLSLCGGIYIVPLYALIQQYSPVTRRSRMIAANNIMNALFMVLSAGWIALLATWQYTIPQIFFSLAIINLFFAAYLLRLLPKPWIKLVLKILLKRLYRVKIQGMENYEAAGERFFITLNYTSFMDIIILSVFLPDTLGLAVDEKLVKKYWIRPFLMLATVYPITAWHCMTTKKMIHATHHSHKFILFPEGHLQESDSLKQIYEASGLIVRKTGFPILPIQIEGALLLPFSRMKGKVPTQWFPKITLNILPVSQLTAPVHYTRREARRWIAHQLFKHTTDRVFNTSPWKRTLFDALLDMRKIHGKRPIAQDIQQQSMRYQDIVTRSCILGAALAKNTTQGEYVGLILPTMINSMICFFSLQAYGRVPAMLNFSIGLQRLQDACVISNIHTIYTSRVFIAKAKLTHLVEGLLAMNKCVIYLEDLRQGITTFDKIKGAVRGFLMTHFSALRMPIDSTLPAVILFTSGSEGAPKGVALSHQNILANTYQIATCVDFTIRDYLFNALPIFHCFGLTGGMLLPLLHGFPVFFYPSPLHYRVVPEWVYKTNATIFLATDTFLNGYAHYANTYDFHTVRCIFAGAEKVKEETMKTWMSSFSTRIFEGYGITEAAPVIAVNNAMQHKQGTVGCLLPGMQARLTPFEGIKQGGRLWVSGVNVMIGYLSLDNPGVIVPLKDGWHDTGDIATFDDAGYLTLLGRARRFAKIGGELVSLQAVENAVSTLWPTHLHAVLNFPDEKKGEQLLLITNCPDAKREILVHHMRYHEYGELFIPKNIHILSDIPVLGTGKIDYAALITMMKI